MPICQVNTICADSNFLKIPGIHPYGTAIVDKGGIDGEGGTDAIGAKITSTLRPVVSKEYSATTAIGQIKLRMFSRQKVAVQERGEI